MSGIQSYYPASDLRVVVLSNRESGAWEPVEMIARAVPDAPRHEECAHSYMYR